MEEEDEMLQESNIEMSKDNAEDRNAFRDVELQLAAAHTHSALDSSNRIRILHHTNRVHGG